MSTTRQSHLQKRALLLIPFLALALLLSVQAGAEVISDFNDGVPDWEAGLPDWAVPGPYFDKVVFKEMDGDLAMQLTTRWLGAAHWKRSLTITNGVTAEVRLDVVRSPDFAFGMVGLKGSPGENVEVGYYLMITPWWVAVTEYQFDYSKPASAEVDNIAEWNWLIPQIENLRYSDVTFGMTLTGVGDAVEITLSVWDRSSDRNLLFRQSVVDAVKPGGGSLNMPFTSFSHIFVGMHQLPSTTFPDSMAVDNLEYEYRPSSVPLVINAERQPGGIVISWPIASSPGMILEMTDSLPNGAWSPVPVEPTVSGDQKKVTLEAGGTSHFFRLRRPGS